MISDNVFQVANIGCPPQVFVADEKTNFVAVELFLSYPELCTKTKRKADLLSEEYDEDYIIEW